MARLPERKKKCGCCRLVASCREVAVLGRFPLLSYSLIIKRQDRKAQLTISKRVEVSSASSNIISDI